MHQLEKKILKLSITVLFLSILVVYALFYQVKGSQIKSKMLLKTENLSTQLYIKDGDEKQLIGSLAVDNTNKNTIKSGDIDVGIKINKVDTGNVLNIKDTKISNEIKYLPGTKLFYGVLESIEKLGIAYKYVLVDEIGIYYIYLGDFKYDISNIARKLGGNIYAINTEQEILKNNLFGDKIVFVNLPEYKNKFVLMIVYIANDIWLLQIDYKLYHKSKTYLQSLFID